MAGFVAAFANPFNYIGGVSFSPQKDIPDLTGKVALVTGGNSGLGKESILQLARHNPFKIFLAARSESKAVEAIDSIRSSIANDVEIVWLPLDLTSTQSIRSAGEQFKSQCQRLDILILNAGVMSLPSGETEMGHEIQLGTNHTGHFLLTKMLLPILLKTAEELHSDVRVVSLASVGHNLAPCFDTILDQEKLKKVNTNARYGASKAANILFAAEISRRYPSITSVSVHPGIILTDLYDSMNSRSQVIALGSKSLRLFGSSISKGAYNQLWAAAGARKKDLVNGGYYVPVGNLKHHNKYAQSVEMGRRLWEWSEGEAQKWGF
ncbi:Putative Dehydrogenase with different specificitie [Penicillium brasilianum]|uniref:Putative Dehydrogenase with different specificitie n=1 Tax=Penicillium brasilianum TaxID=104259 RepID=A0A0F7V949_PENBI|nr:Putative Dehydrogenase with different specificitie [Penicillium brasilianum]